MLLRWHSHHISSLCHSQVMQLIHGMHTVNTNMYYSYGISFFRHPYPKIVKETENIKPNSCRISSVSYQYQSSFASSSIWSSFMCFTCSRTLFFEGGNQFLCLSPMNSWSFLDRPSVLVGPIYMRYVRWACKTSYVKAHYFEFCPCKASRSKIFT
jgi:hypothetical protein